MLALSPGALADGDQATVVALEELGPDYVLNYQTLDGVITHSVPVPSNIMIDFVPAANGSIVFMEAGPNSNSGDALWLMRPDGSTVELDSSPTDFDPSISYDGSKIVFARGDPTAWKSDLWASDLYVINADGTGLRRVVSGGGQDLRQPRFSPDGGSIAYWCGPADGTDNQSKGCGPLTDGSYRNSGVMRINADGSNPRIIVIGGGDADEPQGPNELNWSPDGRWILLDGLLTQSQLFAYHTDGSDLFNNADPSRQVTHETGPWGAFDGQFCGNSTQILFNKVHDDNGNEGDFSYAINRDGTNRRQIFLSPLGLQYGVCVLPASGGAAPPLVDATHVRVPSVHALGVKAAKSKLKADNLGVGRVTYKYSATVRKSHVLAQKPKAGGVAHRTAKTGPPVALIVSHGKRHRPH
jgi:PASTA domain